MLKKTVYGLPEFYRAEIRKADVISNPGCYPTVSTLALLPLVSEGLIDLDSIIVDAKSGVSGAGKKLATSTHFSEANENFNAYKVNEHQHMPEIGQNLNYAAHAEVSFAFVPHLLPVNRGILSTIYVKKRSHVKPAQLAKALEQYFSKEPFVRFLGENKFPALNDVVNTNFCDIGVKVDAKTGRVILISAIDNLLKGASGQAVQNMNIRLGFSEETALL